MASLQHAIADCKAARDSVFPHVSNADALPALHRAARSVSRLHDALTEADAPPRVIAATVTVAQMIDRNIQRCKEKLQLVTEIDQLTAMIESAAAAPSE